MSVETITPVYFVVKFFFTSNESGKTECVRREFSCSSLCLAQRVICFVLDVPVSC